MFDIEGPIVVHVPFSDRAAAVLASGLSQARDARRPLIACAVLPELFGAPSFAPALQAGFDGRFLQAAQRARHRVEELVRQVAPSTVQRMEVVIDAGSPHETILRLADECQAGLLVVDGGDVNEDAALPLHRVLRDARCPVLVVRPTARGPVLAATDLSDPSLSALRAASRESRRLDAPLVLTHAVAGASLVPSLPWEAFPVLTLAVVDRHRIFAKERLDELALQLDADEVVVVEDDPVRAVVDQVEALGAQLVVVGSHGWSMIDRMALGSVSESIAERAPCSVLVVRCGGPEPVGAGVAALAPPALDRPGEVTSRCRVAEVGFWSRGHVTSALARLQVA